MTVNVLQGILNATGIYSTYNATYTTLLNQTCPAGQVVSSTLVNGTFTCMTPTTPNNAITLDIANITNFLFNYNETTIAKAYADANITVAKAYADANMTISVLQGILNTTGIYSTYNATYTTLLNQTCPAGQVVSSTLVNGTFTCMTPTTPNNAITLDIANITNFLFNYNETTIAKAYADANMTVNVLQGILNATGIYSTYNATYTTLLNQTCPAGQVVSSTLVNGTFTCMTPTTPNNAITLDIANITNFLFNYNETTIAKAYADANMTISVLQGILNTTGIYSTYNATYTTLLNQTCPPGQVVNSTLVNGTFRCMTPTTPNNAITLDIANITNFLFNYNETTIAKAYADANITVAKAYADANMTISVLQGILNTTGIYSKIG